METTPFATPADLATRLMPAENADHITEWVTEAVRTRAATRPRNLQRTPGPSSIGTPCERELAFKLAGNKPVNHSADPLRSIVGTAFHAWMAETMTALDGGTGRYLIEHPVTFRGVAGTCDLYDRHKRRVIDWKTTTLRTINRIAEKGPSASQRVQLQTYMAALAEQGEDPATGALVYLPVDGRLDQVHTWITDYAPTVAEAAVDRLAALSGTDPADAEPTPSRLCPWCSFYRPNSTDPSTGCAGPEERTRA